MYFLVQLKNLLKNFLVIFLVTLCEDRVSLMGKHTAQKSTLSLSQRVCVVPGRSGSQQALEKVWHSQPLPGLSSMVKLALLLRVQSIVVLEECLCLWP